MSDIRPNLLSDEQNYTQLMTLAQEKADQIFDSFYTREDVMEQLRVIKKGLSSAPRARAALQKMCSCLVPPVRPVFDDKGIPAGQDQIISAFPSEEEVETRMYRVMYDMYVQFPSSEAYIARIVRRLGDPDLQDSSVRLSIVRQFLRYTDFNTAPVKKLLKQRLSEEDVKAFTRLSKADKEEWYVKAADEALFDALDIRAVSTGDWRKDHDARRNLQKKYRLLALADDLASGRFRTNGGTRSDLYYFAAAFQMRAYPDAASSDYDPSRDIEKNLFYDYYHDNLLRYVSGSYLTDASSQEAEPVGEGINYKNFTEVIFLYYLEKPALTPRERLKKIEDTIDQCVKLAQTPDRISHMAESPEAPDLFDFTGSYRSLYTEELYKIPEAQLPLYICDHFYIPPEVRSGSKLMAASLTNTASEEYNRILDDIRASQTFLSEELDIGSGVDFECDALLSVSDDNFLRILHKFDEKLHLKRAKGATLFSPDPESRISRTDMIALAYYRYILKQEEETSRIREHIPLRDIFDDFSYDVNPHLTRSRFQALTSKNIYDMFVVFALYRQLNLLG